MRRWKTWAVVSFVALVIIFVALVIGAWNNISSEWLVERAAAQYALNHSPIDQIKRHEVFTANQAQEVFYGDDAFGTPWYVFVYGDPFVLHSTAAAPLMTQKQADQAARAEHVTPISAYIGYLDASAAAIFRTTSGVVWEVYGRDQNGQPTYVYFHADSKKPIH